MYRRVNVSMYVRTLCKILYI